MSQKKTISRRLEAEQAAQSVLSRAPRKLRNTSEKSQDWEEANDWWRRYDCSDEMMARDGAMMAGDVQMMARDGHMIARNGAMMAGDGQMMAATVR